MQTITLKQKFVNKQKNTKRLFLTTSKNLFLKKGSTGIGGTTTILQATCANRIVVSPTIGMIQGKENQKSQLGANCFFIYGGSKDTWADYFQTIENGQIAVVNCTPEQIISLQKHDKDKFEKIKDLTIFVDEIHQYIPDGSYRDALPAFLDILFNQWRANWILSSATDNRVLHKHDITHHLDIPPGVVYESYNIVREGETTKEIEVLREAKPVSIKLVDEMITEALIGGRKLIVASNSSILHKQIARLKKYNVVNLVGSNIEVKLRPVKDAEKIQDIDWGVVDIVVISSKYFAGFDIPLGVDVLIDTCPHTSSSSINVNNQIQIIGRARKFVNRVVVHINLKRPEIETSNLYVPIIQATTMSNAKKELIDKIKTITKKNWAWVAPEVIADWTYYTLIYPKLLAYEYLRYNCVLIKYKKSSMESYVDLSKMRFDIKLKKLIADDLQQLKFDYGRIRKYLKYKLEGVFPPQLALLFYTAIQIKEKNLKDKIKLTDKTRPTAFFMAMNKHFKHDEEWLLLYQYLKTQIHTRKSLKGVPKHALFDKEYLDYLDIRSLPSKEAAMICTTNLQLYKISLNELHRKGISPSKYESDKLLSRCTEVYHRNDPKEFKGFRTKKQLLNLIGWANLYLINEGRESYNFPEKRNRIYNPLTQIPGPLRGMIAVDLIEIDIKHANPTFIDTIVKSRIANVVYKNIMKAYGISRGEAKIKYNTYLNNDTAKTSQIINFFSNIGYTHDQAIDITEMVKSKKGEVYDRMTDAEKDIINTISDIHLKDKPWYRFHDAIICRKYDVFWSLESFPKQHDGIEFEFKYYNDNTKVVTFDKRGSIKN